MLTGNFQWLLLAYLLGSLPFALWVGKWVKGIDIREVGSLNMGASNVFRELGAVYGIVVLLLDMLKAYAAVQLYAYIDTNGWMGQEKGFWQLLLGGFAVLGHLFPLFAGFRGGKGVACLFGMVLAIQPWIALICVGVFLVVVWLTRYISLGSIVGVLVFAGCVWFAFRETDVYIKWFSIVAAVTLLWMHRKNLHRLLQGTERKISVRKKRNSGHSD
ncbi:MAG: glycerol-3-phosphate 1-O-acyltransferase PlsY [Bacteroidetes bacterium]|nr:glycerol-3-phosphate 1-O-acyltransferase PlsY [Bacteroidota bacterium]